MRIISIMLAAAAIGCYASADVVQVTPNGVLLQSDVAINATPSKVYSAIINNVGSWWSSSHTFSGDAKNLSIDARAGGCFCERLPNGGGVEHLRVVFLSPDKLIRFSGALGPLQMSAVAGSMTWELAPTDKGTNLKFTYIFGGYMQGGFDKIAPAADMVLREQLARLKRFVETGAAEGPAKP